VARAEGQECEVKGMNTGIQDARNLGWKLGQVLAGARGPFSRNFICNYVDSDNI
jgi:hypothetical protein